MSRPRGKGGGGHGSEGSPGKEAEVGRDPAPRGRVRLASLSPAGRSWFPTGRRFVGMSSDELLAADRPSG